MRSCSTSACAAASSESPPGSCSTWAWSPSSMGCGCCTCWPSEADTVATPPRPGPSPLVLSLAGHLALPAVRPDPDTEAQVEDGAKMKRMTTMVLGALLAVALSACGNHAGEGAAGAE